MTIPPAFFDAIEDATTPFKDRLRHAIEMTTGEAEYADEIKAHPRWEAWVQKNRAGLTRFRNRMAARIERGDTDDHISFSDMVERPLLQAMIERLRQTGDIDRTLSRIIDRLTPGAWTLIYTTDEGASVLTSLSVENTSAFLERAAQSLKERED